VLAGQAAGNGHGAEAAPDGAPGVEAGVAEAGLDGAGEAMAALDRPNGTDPGPAALDGPGEPAAVSAPF
jgi:hypothetical protein